MAPPEMQTPGGNRASTQQITEHQNDTAADAERKAFEGYRAEAAFLNYTLARTNPADGPVSYYASRWGLVRELRNLAEVAEFVRRIGGAA